MDIASAAIGEASPAWVEEKIAASGRKCAECSLCCKILDVPELDKPAHRWCEHCRPGRGGCSIYDKRPTVCREFACAWLIDATLPDYWFPKRSKMVPRWVIENGEVCFRLSVDPAGDADRWHRDPYFRDLIRLARSMPVYIHVGQEVHRFTP